MNKSIHREYILKLLNEVYIKNNITKAKIKVLVLGRIHEEFDPSTITPKDRFLIDSCINDTQLCWHLLEVCLEYYESKYSIITIIHNNKPIKFY